jgi:hypothetical protein
MFISPDADGIESAANISRALGMFQNGWRQQADKISDYVIENMQEIVSGMNVAERRLTPIPNVGIDNTEPDLRRQVAAARPEVAFTSRSLEEPFSRK